MSGGKIDPLIAAASEEIIRRMREEIRASVEATVSVIAQEILPLQQDVARLNERVRNLEQGRDTPTVSDGQTKQKYTK